MPKPEPKPIEDLTYEEAVAELETVVTGLESEGRPLDESLALFERGQALVRHCVVLLEQADLKVRQLSGDELIDAPDLQP
ncbi:MAG: exodeoxyribonuclease VII small subunit [Anaerolineales bacterium]|nr:exodeoxyribonuclease VII small subunit [Anaerolineales bacterium]